MYLDFITLLRSFFIVQNGVIFFRALFIIMYGMRESR